MPIARKNMKRKCFLCDVNTESIFCDKWDLPGIDSCEIGFSICPRCGLIIQSPAIDGNNMDKYYSETATYINPGRKGKPSLTKINDVKRLIRTLIDILGELPCSAFQVGCSDGYTLYSLQQAGVRLTEGIDPGLESHKLAMELYDINTVVGTFEDFVPSRKYELIILTHILEHIYDPLTVMKKCCSMQKHGDWGLIEVPLFERSDKFPPGLLTLEHVNYFSESTLCRLLYLSGYAPYMIQKSFYNNLYPVITVIARKENCAGIELSSDYDRGYNILTSYIERDKQSWKRIESKIRQKIRYETATYVWGAGIHTSQLFANTDLREYLKIKGLIDSSPTKWGKNLGSMTCYSPDKVILDKGDVILISSYASEQEIYDSLKSYQGKGINIIRIYGE